MSSQATSWTLRLDDIHVWTAHLAADPTGEAEALSILSAAERARASSLASERNRSRFVQAHGLMRRILANYLGVMPQRVTFAYGPHGKPCLDDAAHGRDLQFSLSHSGDCCWLAVALGEPLGIDVEQLRPVPQAHNIACRFFAPAEARLLDVPDQDVRERMFFALWTHKEAAVKAVGASLAQSLASIELEPDADGVLRLSPTAARRLPGCEVGRVEAGPGSAAAVARLGRRIGPLQRRSWQEVPLSCLTSKRL